MTRPLLRPDCPYSLADIRAAFERTVAHFRANPRSWVRGHMSDAPSRSPFVKKTKCWCFAGRLARELGPLPEDYRREHFGPATPYGIGYEPGYAELGSIKPGLDAQIYYINDMLAFDLTKVLREERRLFARLGLAEPAA